MCTFCSPRQGVHPLPVPRPIETPPPPTPASESREPLSPEHLAALLEASKRVANTYETLNTRQITPYINSFALMYTAEKITELFEKAQVLERNLEEVSEELKKVGLSIRESLSFAISPPQMADMDVAKKRIATTSKNIRLARNVCEFSFSFFKLLLPIEKSFLHLHHACAFLQTYSYAVRDGKEPIQVAKLLTTPRKTITTERIGSTLFTKVELFKPPELEHFRESVSLMHEATMMPHILPLLYAQWEKGCATLYLAPVTTSLQARILTKERPKGLVAKKICAQVLESLISLHSSTRVLHGKRLESGPIIHNTLTAKSIFIDETGAAQVAGMYNASREGALLGRSSATHAAPELLCKEGARASQAQDIWAFGILVFQLMKKVPPFSSAILEKTVAGAPFLSKQEEIDTILNEKLAEESDLRLLTLCKKILRADPRERPTAEILKRDSYFTNETPIEVSLADSRSSSRISLGAASSDRQIRVQRG